MNIKNEILWRILSGLIEKLEQQGDIIINYADNDKIVEKIYEEIEPITMISTVTTEQLSGVRSLILHAIDNKRFFDWEMPTLTGYSAEEFEDIACKFPNV